MKHNLKVVTVFYLTLLSICILIGVVYSANVIDANVIGTDLLSSFKIINISSLLIEVGVITISFLLSFLIIGEIIFIIFFSSKAFSLGFIFYSFIKIYGIKGFLISISYFIIHLFIFFLLFIMMLSLFKYLKIGFFRVFKSEFNNNVFVKNTKRVILIFLLYIMYNGILYLFQNFIVDFFSYLI